MGIIECHCGRKLIDKVICGNCGMDYSNLSQDSMIIEENRSRYRQKLHDSQLPKEEVLKLQLEAYEDAREGEKVVREIEEEEEMKREIDEKYDDW